MTSIVFRYVFVIDSYLQTLRYFITIQFAVSPTKNHQISPKSILSNFSLITIQKYMTDIDYYPVGQHYCVHGKAAGWDLGRGNTHNLSYWPLHPDLWTKERMNAPETGREKYSWKSDSISSLITVYILQNHPLLKGQYTPKFIWKYLPSLACKSKPS